MGHAIVYLFASYEKSEDRSCAWGGILPFLRILGARNADVDGVETRRGAAILEDMASVQ